jgi:hypothetical protein
VGLLVRIANQGEFFECKLYSRKPNSLEHNDIGISFRARAITDREKRDIQPIAGMMVDNVTIALYTSNLPVEISTEDRIEFNGESYMVAYAMNVMSNVPYTMGASRFSTKHMSNKLPKLIGLK